MEGDTQFDFVEEKRLRDHDMQLSLQKMWRNRLDGCPHYHGMPEGPAVCELNEMRICVLELGEPCEIFGEIIDEWYQELAEKGEVPAG